MTASRSTAPRRRAGTRRSRRRWVASCWRCQASAGCGTGCPARHGSSRSARTAARGSPPRAGPARAPRLRSRRPRPRRTARGRARRERSPRSCRRGPPRSSGRRCRTDPPRRTRSSTVPGTSSGTGRSSTRRSRGPCRTAASMLRLMGSPACAGCHRSGRSCLRGCRRVPRPRARSRSRRPGSSWTR